MHAASAPPLTCRIAACREDLADGKEWSIFILNDMHYPVEVSLARVSYEWGDHGDSEAPEVHLRLLPQSSALLWREKWEGAEMNMELSIRLQAPGQNAKLLFELGKLYRQRTPAMIEGLGRLGWLHIPSHSSQT